MIIAAPPSTQNLPIAVIANKSDLPGALSSRELETALDLKTCVEAQRAIALGASMGVHRSECCVVYATLPAVCARV